MATIQSTNITIPEVLYDIMQYEYENALKLGKLAYHDNTLVGNPGNEVTIPYVAPLADAVDVPEGQALTAVASSDSEIKIPVKKVGNAFTMTQEAINACAYDLKNNRMVELAKSMARKADADLATEIAKTTLVSNPTKFDYAAVVDAKGLMGEEGFSVQTVLLTSTKMFTELSKTPEFIAGATQITNFGIEAAAMLVDMPVIVSDRVADDEAFIIVPGSFVLANKQHPKIYPGFDNLKEETTVSSFMHYGVKLPNVNRGVVKIKKQG